jgi:hypothetical protein
MSLGNVLLIPGIGKRRFLPTSIASLLWWYDPYDLSTMFQDDAGTTPVTAANQTVGRILDKSGNGYHRIQPSADSRPILRNSGGLWYLEYDGVDDGMYTVGNVNHSVSDEVTVCMGMRKLSDAALAAAYSLSSTPTSTNGTFCLFAPSTAAANFAARSRGTTNSITTASGLAAPITGVMTQQAKIATPISLLRRNGSQITSTSSSQGTGNYSSQIMYFGDLGGLNRCQMYEYGSAGFTTVLTGTDLANIEQFMAEKAEVTL